MWIYEVSVKVEQNILDEYLLWIKDHAAKVTKAGGFLEFHIFKTLSSEHEIVTQYLCHEKDIIDRYIVGPAIKLRMEAETKFGNKFKAHRRILSPL